MNKIFIIFIIITSTSNVYCQNKTIEGRVTTDFFETAPGMIIMLNDTIKVGKTDINGFFKIELPISVNKILIWSLGLEPASIELVNTCEYIEVVMMPSGTYDFMTLKKVDRLRFKDFKKLPKLHKEAFQKGIFKTEEACYLREFIPYYKKQKIYCKIYFRENTIRG